MTADRASRVPMVVQGHLATRRPGDEPGVEVRCGATSLHSRSLTSAASGQCRAGASRRATVAGSTETAGPVLAKPGAAPGATTPAGAARGC